jgi:hypothetical protein
MEILFPISKITRVAGDEKNEVEFKYSEAKGHEKEIVLLEKIPIQTKDDPMEVEEVIVTETEPPKDPEEEAKIEEVMRETSRRAEINYLVSHLDDFHAVPPVPVEENLVLEVVPFKSLALRDPTSGSIVKMLPFPYSKTKMVKVFRNDINASIQKHLAMFSSYPRPTYTTEVYQIWEVPFPFDPVVSYRTGAVFKAELEEAHAAVKYYGVTPYIQTRASDIEVWQIPSSCPLPETKEKIVKIQKKDIPEALQSFRQRFLCSPRVVSNLNPQFDLWSVPLSF